MPAGPAPIIATFLSVHFLCDISGFHPISNAFSVIYFSVEPIVTAPKPSFNVHAPSHNLSCGHTLPQTSGKLLVEWHNSAASIILPSLTSFNQSGIKL